MYWVFGGRGYGMKRLAAPMVYGMHKGRLAHNDKIVAPASLTK